MNIEDNKMSPCKTNECVIMTKREFLAYALSERFVYYVTFEREGVANATELCEKQSLNIYLYNPEPR